MLTVWSSPAAGGAPIQATPARASASKALTEVRSRCQPHPQQGNTAWSPSLMSACVLWRTTITGLLFSVQVNEQCLIVGTFQPSQQLSARGETF